MTYLPIMSRSPNRLNKDKAITVCDVQDVIKAILNEMFGNSNFKKTLADCVEKQSRRKLRIFEDNKREKGSQTILLGASPC